MPVLLVATKIKPGRHPVRSALQANIVVLDRQTVLFALQVHLPVTKDPANVYLVRRDILLNSMAHRSVRNALSDHTVGLVITHVFHALLVTIKTSLDRHHAYLVRLVVPNQ